MSLKNINKNVGPYSNLQAGQIVCSEIIRLSLYTENSNLFDCLPYDNDHTFLEPSLFCYFLSDIPKQDLISLEQSLFGYIPEDKRPAAVSLRADRFGMVNLPNLGYLRAESDEWLTLDASQIAKGLIPNQFIEESDIRLCLHPTDLLGRQSDISFYEPVEKTLLVHKDVLSQAVKFLQTHVSDLWQLIASVTREFVVFNSPPEHHSFAGIMHHGTAYFNVENESQTPVFFIDDISHQCGHIIFNALTLETDKYLRVSKDHPLKEFTGQSWEGRGVYGAFHGLFTYTTILHSLDRVIETKAFPAEMQHEALGRIGFYMNKFILDLQIMNNPKILTEEGLKYHQLFAEECAIMYEKYQNMLQNLRYDNQPYTFQYNLFAQLNPIHTSQIA